MLSHLVRKSVEQKPKSFHQRNLGEVEPQRGGGQPNFTHKVLLPPDPLNSFARTYLPTIPKLLDSAHGDIPVHQHSQGTNSLGQ